MHYLKELSDFIHIVIVTGELRKMITEKTPAFLNLLLKEIIFVEKDNDILVHEERIIQDGVKQG